MDNHTWERGEEKIQNGLPTMARDAETGECWLQQQPSVTEELGDKPSGFPIFAKCTKHYATIKAWKIPKEYSNLGSSSKSLSTSNLSLTIGNQASEETFRPTWTSETEMASNSSTIITNFPCVGKLPSLFRKRSLSPPKELASKEIRKCTNSRTKCFLEGREKSLFAGHLLFAFILIFSPLLSPFFIYLLQIGKYHHYQSHSGNEETSLLKL